jgi:rod shape-determining protein MreB
VLSKSIRVAGDKMDEAIVQYIKRKYNLLIGERTAEIIKKEIGSHPLRSRPSRSGRDLVAGAQDAAGQQRRSARRSRAGQRDRRCRALGARTHPPELSADTSQGCRAVVWRRAAGNLDVLLREETGLPVMVCENPQLAVVLGTGKVLDNLGLLREIALR